MALVCAYHLDYQVNAMHYSSAHVNSLVHCIHLCTLTSALIQLTGIDIVIVC